MQLCMAQAHLDCLKQAIDQKIVGPQRREFVRTCVGGVVGRSPRSTNSARAQARSADGPREGVSPRMVVENPDPWLSAYRLRDLSEVRHPAAVWLLQLGIEQPQDSDIDAVMITCRTNNRLNVLPPGRHNRHGVQATDRATVGCHQHQLCSSWLCHPPSPSDCG